MDEYTIKIIQDTQNSIAHFLKELNAIIPFKDENLEFVFNEDDTPEVVLERIEGLLNLNYQEISNLLDYCPGHDHPTDISNMADLTSKLKFHYSLTIDEHIVQCKVCKKVRFQHSRGIGQWVHSKPNRLIEDIIINMRTMALYPPVIIPENYVTDSAKAKKGNILFIKFEKPDPSGGTND